MLENQHVHHKMCLVKAVIDCCEIDIVALTTDPGSH